MARGGSKSVGLSIPELRHQVADGGPRPTYLLLGDEAAIRRRALEIIRAPVEEADAAPGSVVQIDAAVDGLGAVVDEARSLPLFGLMADGPSRLVWVKGLDLLENPKRGAADDAAELDDASLEELDAYLADPVIATCLVFEAEKLNKSRKLYKRISKHAVIVNCETPKGEREVATWIEATLRNAGHAVEPDAVAYLLQMAGNQITVLEQELEKAMLYAGPGGAVTVAALEGIMGRSREHSVFELTDALVRGDDVGAIRLLNMLLDDGEEPVRLLAMIAWICRQLVIAKDLAAAARSRKEAMQGLGGRWQQRGAILDRAQRAGRGRLEQTLVACAETDLFVKGRRDRRQGVDRLRPARGRLEALCRQICAA